MANAGAAPQPDLAVASGHRNDCGFHCIAHTLLQLPDDVINDLVRQHGGIYHLIAEQFFERYGLSGEPNFKDMLMFVRSYNHPFDHEILLGPVLRETVRRYQNQLNVTAAESEELHDWQQVSPEVLTRFANALGADFHVDPQPGGDPGFTINEPLNPDGPPSRFVIKLMHMPGKTKVVNGNEVQFGHYNFSYPDVALNAEHNQKIDLRYGDDGNILDNRAELYNVAVGGEDEAARLDLIRGSFQHHIAAWQDDLRAALAAQQADQDLSEEQVAAISIATPEVIARLRPAIRSAQQPAATQPRTEPPPPIPRDPPPTQAAPELEHLVTVRQGTRPQQTQAVDPSADELFIRRQGQSAAPTGPSLTAKPKPVPVTPSAPQTHPPVDPTVIRSKFIDKLRKNFGDTWEVLATSPHEINVREKLRQDRNVKITETNDIYKFTATPADMVAQVAMAANTYHEVLKDNNEDIEYEIEVGSPAQAREFLRELNQGNVSIEAISTIKVRGAPMAEAEVKAMIEEIKPTVSNTPSPRPHQ